MLLIEFLAPYLWPRSLFFIPGYGTARSSYRAILSAPRLLPRTRTSKSRRFKIARHSKLFTIARSMFDLRRQPKTFPVNLCRIRDVCPMGCNTEDGSAITKMIDAAAIGDNYPLEVSSPGVNDAFRVERTNL